MSHFPLYEGYLGQVSQDHFNDLTHSRIQIYNEIPPDLKAGTDPTFGSRFFSTAWDTAKLGALGNFMGDAARWAAGKELAPTAWRADIQEASALTLGWLTIVGNVRNQACAGKTPEAVRQFEMRAQSAFLDGAKPEPPIRGLWEEGQRTVFYLGNHAHDRLRLNDPDRKDAIRRPLAALAAASANQFNHPPTSTAVDALETAGMDLGVATASTVFEFAQLRYGGEYPTGGRAALAIGTIAGMLDHGSRVKEHIENGVPTFATALLYQAGGPTNDALHEIASRRRVAVQTAYEDGYAALCSTEKSDENVSRALGAYTMAKDLLQIVNRLVRAKEQLPFPGISYRRRIEAGMNAQRS